MLWSTLLAITTPFLLFSPIDAHAVGRVSSQTGPTEIMRGRQSLPSGVNTDVKMNDTVITARSRTELTFRDNTRVMVNEQSRLLIDDFVYDPNSGAGRLAVKVALGTARYASGQIAKTNPQQVKVQTPTATIAVRGTDFTMTVDEMGRSLVVLLPSCDASSCVIGQIEVSTAAGSVLLTQAFQATLVVSQSLAPSRPVLIQIDPANIDNLLIVSPPAELDAVLEKANSDTLLDANELDQDLLAFDELDRDWLDSRNLLERNRLDSSLLNNFLDISNNNLVATQEQMLETAQRLPKYNAESGLRFHIDNDSDRLMLWRDTAHYAQVTLDSSADAHLTISQNSVVVYQQINAGGTTTINIVQQ